MPIELTPKPKCSVTECNKPSRHKGLCSTHYKRWWRHGDAELTYAPTRGRSKKCIVDECNNFARGEHNLCNKHRQRLVKYGRLHTIRAKNGEGGPWISTNGYRILNIVGKKELEHRVVAADALGKELPPNAVVHHINGDTLDNRKENLLICTQAYHLYLHRQMRGDSAWQE